MLNEEDMFDDLAYDEAEGSADAYDEFDEYEEGDEFDEYEESDEFDEYEEADELDEFDEFDEGEESEDELDGFDTVVASALGAEDSDEFLSRLGAGLRRVAQGVRRGASAVGRVARTAAPVLSMIPHPYAQAAGRVAGLLGRLQADGASEDEALDAMAEYAVRDRRALPAVAGLAVRAVSRAATARMPMQQRKAAVKTVRRSLQRMANRQGPQTARVAPKVARSVRRTAAARGTPPAARPRVLQRTVRRVAQNPRMAQRLSTPSPQGRATLRRAAGATAGMPTPAVRRAGGMIGGGRSATGRTINLRGPVRINIRPN